MNTEKKLKERAEERRDTKARVTIIHKETDEVVDVKELSYDAAEDWGRSQISGRPELKYRIYQVGSRVS